MVVLRRTGSSPNERAMVGKALAMTVADRVCIISAPPMMAGTREENGSASRPSTPAASAISSRRGGSM